MTKQPPSIVEAELVALLKKIVARDESAFGVFYDQTVGYAYGLILRILKSPEQTEEVVDDVYLQIWSQAARFDPKRSGVLAWLLMLCRSRALDTCRHNTAACRHGITVEDYPEEEEASFVAAPDLLLATEEGHAIHQALKSLPPDQRQLLALAFFRGYSHEELAQYTSIPLGTIKSRIRRALQALQAPLVRLNGPRKETANEHQRG